MMEEEGEEKGRAMDFRRDDGRLAFPYRAAPPALSSCGSGAHNGASVMLPPCPDA